jgi:uncharacterized protein YbaP (TraB family)
VLRSLLAGFALLASITLAHSAPAIWEARDADSRVVLFGSVHALPPGLDWRTPLLADAMEDAPLVYFETDIGPLGMASMTIKIIVQQLQAAGEPWLDRLTSEQVDKLIAAIEPLGMSFEEATFMQPWVLAMQLTDLAMREGATGPAMEMEHGVENVLQWDLPKERKAYFETPGQQFDMLAGGTVEQQIQQLFMVIDEGTADGAQLLEQIVLDWMAGDVDQLIMEPKNDDEAAVLDLLLAQRNRNWLQVIEGMLADNNENLIVVGAAHLSGEDSVLDLLAAAGYTVNRIQ